MKRSQWMAILVAGLAVTACDLVKFPGATDAPDAPVTTPPPPPNTVTETATTSDDLAATTPIVSGSDDASGPETLPADGSTQPSDEAVTADSQTEQGSPYANINDLLIINAARCAPTSEEASLTLAELTGATVASATVTAQAVNGTQTTSAAFPGIVKMEPKRTLASGGISSGHCGATRIAKNWFITASHCLDDTYDEIELIATESSLTDPRAVKVKATASLCHAAYGGAQGQYSNDIALVGISDADTAAFDAVPIARYGTTDQALGAINYPTARMAGWGLTSFEGGELSNTLLSTELSVVSSGPALITVASREAAGPCIGDSGGPLLIDESDGASKVVGVLSVVEQNRITGEFCTGSYNARYTNLQGFTDWIDSVIGVCTASPGLCTR